MARKVSATFQGATEQQCDPGSLQYTTVIGNAQGDTALVHDNLTGENTPPALVDHTGGGKGAPLGVPLGAAAVALLGADRPAAGYEDGTQEIYLFAIPIRLPRGETSFDIEIDFSEGADGVDIEVRDTAWAHAGEVASSVVNDFRWHGSGRTLTGGERYFVLVKTLIGPFEPMRKWHGAPRIFFARQNTGPMLVPASSNLSSIAFPVDHETTAGGEALLATDWDEAMFADGRALHAGVTVALNRTQQAIAEYMTAAPAGGSNDLTLDVFHDHSHRVHTSEGTVDLPLIACPLGAVTASESIPDYATNNWGAPAALFDSKTTVVEDVMKMPSFPEGVDTSRLRLLVLVAYPEGTSSAVLYARTRTTSGGELTERSAATTACGTSSFAYVDLGAIAGTGNRIAFVAGVVNALRLSIFDGGIAKAERAARICGYHWYFDGE